MLEDRQIVALFFARDERAIAELSGKYGAVCIRIAKNILKSELDAQECVNDALLAAWRNIPPAKPDPLKNYMLRIVRNRSIAKYHANTAAKRNSYYDAALDELENCLAGRFTIDREIEAKELSAHIDRFLDTLDPTNRVMFMCRYWRSDSIADIAEEFQTNRHNVSVRLSRTRAKLRKYLMKAGVEL